MRCWNQKSPIGMALLFWMAASSCDPDRPGQSDGAIGQDQHLTGLRSYRQARFESAQDQRIQALLKAFEKEEGLLSGMDSKPEQRSEQEIASAVRRCKKLQGEVGESLKDASGERIASHLVAMLSDRTDACLYELYLLELIGRLTGIENEKRVRLQEGEARQLFTTMLTKVRAAKQRWSGDLRWMYLTLCVELTQEYYRGQKPSYPPPPTADDPNWDQKMDKFFDWLRRTLEG